jgi:hypothetical protein
MKYQYLIVSSVVRVAVMTIVCATCNDVARMLHFSFNENRGILDMQTRIVMAKRKRRRVNKRAKILEYLGDHPEATGKTVSEELAKEGIRVSPEYVNTTKSAAKSNGSLKKGRRGRKPGSPAQDMKQAGQLMVQAVDLVMKAGYQQAQSLVEMANEMVAKFSARK